MSDPFKAGELLVTEYGIYSDFSYNGPFKIIKDFDLETVKNGFLEPKTAEERENISLWEGGFEAYLVREGYIEDVGHRTINLGKWDFEPSERSRN